MITVERRRLPSGLTVIAVRRPHLHTAAIGAFVRVGSRYEGREELGIAHFLEHLLFRGSNRLADSIEFSRAVERLGGFVDAGVHQEMTDYIVDVHRDRWREGMELLGDLLLQPAFGDRQVEVERAVLLEELGQYTDSRGDNVNPHELAYHLLWGDGLAQADMGILRRNLESFDRRGVLDFYERYYTAGNTVVVAVGDFELEEAFGAAGTVFGAFGGGRSGDFRPLPPVAERPASIFRVLDTTQVDFCVAMRAYAIGNPRYPASAVLSAILGGGPASRLFCRVREDRGLVYDIRTDVETFRDVGAITVSTYCGEQNLEPTLSAVFDAIDEVRTSGVTDEELDRARGLARASADYLLDNPFDLADWFGRVEALDEPEEVPDPRREAERFATIEMKDVHEVIEDTLKPANRYLAVIGPVRSRQRRRVETLFRQRTNGTA